MKIVIEVDLPPWVRKAAAVGFPSAAIAFSGAAMAVPNTFQSGETLKAADLNANFADHESRLAAVESKTASDSAKIDTLQTQVAALQNAPAPLTTITQVSVPSGSPWYSDCTTNSGIFPQGACARMASARCKALSYVDGWFEGDLQGSDPIVSCIK